MTPTEALLRKISYYAEKAFRHHRDFNWVVFIGERADGSCRSFEVECRAPDSPTPDEVLAGLVHDARIDLAEIGAVVRYAVGYVAHITTKIRPIDPPLPESTTRKRTVVMVEAHSCVGEHLKATREITGKRLLAMGEVEPAHDSIYARLLDAQRASFAQ